MPGFSSFQTFNPLLNALAGAALFFAYYALGKVLLRFVRLPVPSPLHPALSLIIGYQLVVIPIQLLSFSGHASTSAMQGLYYLVLFLGALAALFDRKEWHLGTQLRAMVGLHRVEKLLFVAIIVSYICASLVALLPTTKSDEIKYHLMLPWRVLHDQGLYFYHAPWQLAIFSQMQFQLSLTPLFAVDQFHAGAVLGWLITGVLLYTIGASVYYLSNSTSRSLLAVAATCLSLQLPIWWSNAGAHSIGDLACLAALLGIALPVRDTQGRVGSVSPVVVGIFAATTAATKISLLPLALLCSLISLFLYLSKVREQEKASGFSMLRVTWLATTPWLALYSPLVVYSLVQSGYPFGPVATSWFTSTSFDISIPLREIEISRVYNRSFSSLKGLFSLENLALYSPILWLAILSFVLVGWRNAPSAWKILLLPSVLQTAIVFGYLVITVRYFSGLIFALAIFGFAFTPPLPLTRRQHIFLLGLFLAPWFVLPIVYSSQFMTYVIRDGAGKRFFSRYVALYEDYQVFNRILPAEALLVTPQYISGLYAPRTIIRHDADLPVYARIHNLKSIPPLYLLCEQETCQQWLTDNCRIGKEIYRNESAVTLISRHPLRDSTRGLITLNELDCTY